MITLDYTVREFPHPGRDLKEADEAALHYDLFLGDVIFRVDGADLSATWGWMPVIDFAVCLNRIVNEIVPRKTQSLEFTESENRIDFTLRDGMVEMRTTYVAQQATVSLEELRRAASEFLGRMLDELMARYAALAQNTYIRRIYPNGAKLNCEDA